MLSEDNFPSSIHKHHLHVLINLFTEIGRLTARCFRVTAVLCLNLQLGLSILRINPLIPRILYQISTPLTIFLSPASDVPEIPSISQASVSPKRHSHQDHLAQTANLPLPPLRCHSLPQYPGQTPPPRCHSIPVPGHLFPNWHTFQPICKPH